MDRLISRVKANAYVGPFAQMIGRSLWRLSRAVARTIPLGKPAALARWSGRPTGYVESAGDYIQRATGDTRVAWEGGETERVAPCALGMPLPRFMLEPPPIRWPRREVFRLDDVDVVGGYSAAVLSADGTLIGELSPDVFGGRRHALYGSFKALRRTRLPGRSLLLATPEAQTNFSHWLYDLLPRLLALESTGYDPNAFDHILIEGCAGGYASESLARFNVPIHKIKTLGRGIAYRCESLVVPTMREDHWQTSLAPCELTRIATQLSSDREYCPEEAPRRIWLSRAHAPFRRLRNEKALVPLLDKFGFESLDPEHYSLKDQAAIFRNADVIAGPHTSAMCNWMFCRPGTPVLEIASPWHADVSFWTIADYSKLRYHAFEGMGPSISPRWIAGTRWLDFDVDAGALECALQRIVEEIS